LFFSNSFYLSRGALVAAMSFGPKQDSSLAKDVQLANPPDDSISDLSWSSAGNYLAAASWDGKVRIYDITQNVTGEGKAMITFDGPALSCSWSKVQEYFFLFIMSRPLPERGSVLQRYLGWL
jgi:WD40 repeat protein